MKYEVTLNIGVGGERSDEIEIDDEDIEGLSGSALEEFLEEEWRTWASNYIDGSIKPIEDKED